MRAQAEDVRKSRGSFVAYEFESFDFEHPYHFHYEIEVVFIDDGQGDVVIGATFSDFGPGDIFLIGSNIPHRFRANQGDRYLKSYIVQFSRDCFGGVFFNAVEFTRIRKLIEQTRSGLVIRKAAQYLFNRIRRLIAAEGIDSVINFLRLLSEIDAYESIEIISKDPTQIIEIKIETRISAAVDWIEENYFRTISLDEVANISNMNKNAFCRAFKRKTGKTPMQFINEKRIEVASDQLLNTEISITEISFNVGFSTLSSFNRNFKSISSLSPKTYREKARTILG